MPELPHVTIYTDGGCSPNPGPGGWGAILIHPETGREKELSGGESDTTNNRMELTGALEALKALKNPCAIDFYTDSQYLRRGITEWMAGWAANNWQRKEKGQWQPIPNADLWQQFDALIQPHEITWHWVKGHAGDTYNERADRLASAAIPRPEAPAADANALRVYLRISGKQARGPYGWAAHVEQGADTLHFQGGHPNTTSNHFTLYAVLHLLNQLPDDARLQFYTNNSYLYDGITSWVAGWKKRGWSKPERFRAEWQALDRLNTARTIQWVRFDRDNEPPPFKQLKEAAEAARDTAATMPAPDPIPGLHP